MTEQLNEARRIVQEICAGQITPELRPSSFEEDTVCFSVWLLEEQDPEWLLAMIADERFSVRDRTNVANNMRELGPRAKDIIGRGT
jgi:hypothetical protein